MQLSAVYCSTFQVSGSVGQHSPCFLEDGLGAEGARHSYDHQPGGAGQGEIYGTLHHTSLPQPQRKCEQYWPESGSEVYGPIDVLLLKEEVQANYTVRTLRLRHLKLARGSKLGLVREVRWSKVMSSTFQFSIVSCTGGAVPIHKLAGPQGAAPHPSRPVLHQEVLGGLA